MSILTNIVGEVPLEAVEDEPALLPRLDLAAHLHQVAFAHLLGEDDEGAGVHAVVGRLHVDPQVKLLLPVGQVARHWPSLGGGMTTTSPSQRRRINGSFTTNLQVCVR